MWNPPPAITKHHGEPLPPDLDFFVAPPAEIGVVRTAFSSLKKGGRAKSTPVRVAIALAWGVVGFLLAMGFHRMTGILIFPSTITGTPPALWAALFALLAAYVGWRYSSFTYSCNYSGDRGCAQFKCEGDRSTLTQKSVFLFKDASAVATRHTRHYKNGVYQHTNFYFHWYSPRGGKPIFDIIGVHYGDGPKKRINEEYSFARSVESAWYDYITPQIDAEFSNKGSVKFYMGYNNWAVVGRGFLQFVASDGKVSRCAAEEIGSAKLSDGNLTIRRKDAKTSFFDLFNHEGVFGFDYANIHNARLFLYLFQKCLGIQVH